MSDLDDSGIVPASCGLHLKSIDGSSLSNDRPIIQRKNFHLFGARLKEDVDSHAWVSVLDFVTVPSVIIRDENAA